MDPKHFKQGVLWNFGSIFLLALSGVGLNVAIGKFYDSAVLGVFNQVLSTYIFFAMFGVGGLNLSALKLISENPNDKRKIDEVILSSVLLTVICSGAATAIYWFSRDFLSEVLESPGVFEGMTWVTPGLFFFGINKTLMAIVNGLKRMREFAVFQSLRFGNLLVGLFIATLLGFPGNRLSVIFSFSEIFLFVVLAIYLRGYYKRIPLSEWRRWIPYHLRFGAKGMFSGALLELNSRVDILMIGFFLSDAKTGIYSMAALIFEGFMQFLIVLQTNYNPHLSSWMYSKGEDRLVEAFRRGRRMTYLYALVLAPVIVLLYPVGVGLVFTAQPEFMQGWLPFGILMGALVIASGYVPFHNILLMAGRPGLHTFFIMITVSFNCLFNWLFIPHFGLVGAAFGTALSLVLSNVTLALFSRLFLGIRLI